MSIVLTCPAFKPGRRIPKQHTGEGADISPALDWSGVPDGAAELALICDDPDAPSAEPWVHWVIYQLPADLSGLPEALPRSPRLDDPPGALQGRNSWPSNNVGYRGPMPPPGHGTHHYHFRLYALDAPLKLEPGATKGDLLRAMEGRVTAKGELIGTYSR
jgi:Raf kinase inhibitor-like YbhB/YbcL family protein